MSLSIPRDSFGVLVLFISIHLDLSNSEPATSTLTSTDQSTSCSTTPTASSTTSPLATSLLGIKTTQVGLYHMATTTQTGHTIHDNNYSGRTRTT
jgi:hypothetical protein